MLYLSQSSLVFCGLVSMLLLSLRDTLSRNLFAGIFGFGAGGFHFSLKMHLYEMSKSRHFAVVWSCLRGVQAVAVAAGITVFGMAVDYNVDLGRFFGAIFFFAAAGVLFVGERCRHHRRYHKCPLHDVAKTNTGDKSNVEQAAKGSLRKKEGGNGVVIRKSSEEYFRAFFGNMFGNFFGNFFGVFYSGTTAADLNCRSRLRAFKRPTKGH